MKTMNIKTFVPILLTLALAGCKGDGGGEGESGESGGSGEAGETGELGDCPSDVDFFERQVWQPILSQTCITCHSETGLAKATRMVLLPEGTEGALEHNLAEAREVAQVDEGGVSLLLLKPTGKHPGGHQGGMVVAEDTEAYRALEEFVQRSLGTFTCDGMTPEEAAGCDMGGAGPRRVRRLSHAEYNRTVAALLGGPTELGSSFAPDTVVQGYSNNAGALLVSGLLADQYREAAETVADQFKAELPARLGCDMAEGEACASSFIAKFGKQAFRRPLTATEQARYEGLWKEAAAAEDFAGGIRWTVAAILQSPNFLYRTELGEHVGEGVYQLTPHELASELSYLITGGPPDATLTAAADDGTLKEPETLAAQAERLMAAADSDATLHRFVDEWLHIDRLKTVPRDMTLYPELTPQVREAMLGETHRFASQVFRGGGTLRELLTAPYSQMTDALAQYYGVPAGGGEADAAGYKQTELDTAAGLLAHGSVLTTHALPTSSSPIHRGKLVRERLFCQEMPPPPPSLDTSPPPVDPTLSTRERYIQHSADPTCNGCHQRIDPIGFGFEHYDAVGRWRDMDGTHAIDSTGEIVLTAASNGTFDGVDELAGLLAGSSDVAACYTAQWSRFALGSAEASELACVEEELGKAFADADGRLDSLVLALVGTRFFRERGGAPTEDPLEPSDTTGGGETGSDDTGSDSTGMPDTTGGDEPGPMTTPGIDVMIVQDSKWESGECNTVTVTNTTDAPIVWEVIIKLPGTMQNAWNCKFTAIDGGFQFTGEAWNTEVAAKTSTSYGFCVTY
jgi:hypothetical protein